MINKRLLGVYGDSARGQVLLLSGQVTVVLDQLDRALRTDHPGAALGEVRELLEGALLASRLATAALQATYEEVSAQRRDIEVEHT